MIEHMDILMYLQSAVMPTWTKMGANGKSKS